MISNCFILPFDFVITNLSLFSLRLVSHRLGFNRLISCFSLKFVLNLGFALIKSWVVRASLCRVKMLQIFIIKHKLGHSCVCYLELGFHDLVFAMCLCLRDVK